VNLYTDPGEFEAALQALAGGIEIRALRCPGCDELPQLVVSPQQAFCGNEDCQAFCWDMTADPAKFKADAETINL